MINQNENLLLELQLLKEKHKKFINWLNDRIECEMRQNTKVKDNSVVVSESDAMNVYLDVLKKFRNVIDEH